MRPMKMLAVVIFCVFMVGCSNADKKEYISEIDQMQNTLDSLSSIANDTTKPDATSVIYSVRSTIANVKENYDLDTVDFDLSEKMNSYKEIKEIISKNAENLAKAKQAIPEVQQKLEDLKHDIEHGVNDRDKYKEYINYEKVKIEEIRSILSYYLEVMQEYYDRYDDLHPIIKSFGDSLMESTHE